MPVEINRDRDLQENRWCWHWEESQSCTWLSPSLGQEIGRDCLKPGHLRRAQHLGTISFVQRHRRARAALGDTAPSATPGTGGSSPHSTRMDGQDFCAAGTNISGQLQARSTPPALLGRSSPGLSFPSAAALAEPRTPPAAPLIDPAFCPSPRCSDQGGVPAAWGPQGPLRWLRPLLGRGHPGTREQQRGRATGVGPRLPISPRFRSLPQHAPSSRDGARQSPRALGGSQLPGCRLAVPWGQALGAASAAFSLCLCFPRAPQAAWPRSGTASPGASGSVPAAHVA